MKNRWHHIFVMVVVAALPVLATTSAWAHADYERSNPPAGAVVAEAPALVEVWFTQELFRREGENTLEVYGPDGSRVDQGDARIDDDDRALMLVSLLPDLPAGSYTVRWRNLSVDDGHPKEGEFGFTVDPAAATAASVTPLPATAPAASTPASATATAPALRPAATPPAPAPSGGAFPCVGGILVGGVTLSAAWRAGKRR